MNQKFIGIAAVVAITWFSWFYRYDPSAGSGTVLDRWTGVLIIRGGDDAVDLAEVETMDQHLSRLLSRPETYLWSARRAGYSDTVILDALAKTVPKFKLDAARAAGYDDTTILEGLVERTVNSKVGKADASAADEHTKQ